MVFKDCNIKKLTDYINEYVKLWDFYGVIQIIKSGEIIFENSYGYASLAFHIKNTMNIRYTLASLTKQFTAFAIMILHDRKLIETDEPANRYLPGNMQIPADITVHHLLSHTSGLHNNYNFEDDMFIGDDRKIYSQSEFFSKYILRQPMENPGTRYDYNNSNYNLLAWIIENVSGMGYEEFLRENIFKPLSMNDTEVDDGIRVLTKKAENYLRDYDKWVKAPYYNEKFSIGAGAIISTCEDLYKWFCCLRDKKLISPKSYGRYFQENRNTYCYGLHHSTVYETDKYWHGGDHVGIQTYMQDFFEEDLCIIILSNNDSLNQYKLGDSISDILHGIDKKITEKVAEIPISDEDMKKYCGTYLEGKIKVEEIGGKLYFTRFNGNLHIELYPMGIGKFARRYCEQVNPYNLAEGDDGIPQFFGYKKIIEQEELN